MAITISFGNQKGGVGKTTTAALTAFLLSKTHRVLAVDFDSQGNLTGQLTQRNIYDFENRTIHEACMKQNPKGYIYPVSENLDLLPAEDKLAFFYELAGTDLHLLDRTLRKVARLYDYIIIDLPPQLGPQTLNGLHASDFIVPVLLTEPHSLIAVNRFLDIVKGQQQVFQARVKVAGILAYSADPHTRIDKFFSEQVVEQFGEQLIVPIIDQRIRVKEFSALGITDNTRADQQVLLPYMSFVEELKSRVQRA